jgi:hypothetical protein
MTSDRYTDDADTARNESPTAHLLDELALYAHRPYDDEADPRPLPEPARLQGALADMFDALVVTLSDTCLEPDLHALLWSVVNVFHRRIDRIERDLDANESAQRMGQREQDGSEVRSVELERLVAQGLTLIERRNSFEFIRDAAAELYGIHTGQAWRPRTGLDGEPGHDDGGDDRQPGVHQRAAPSGRAGASAEGHQDRLRRRRRL